MSANCDSVGLTVRRFLNGSSPKRKGIMCVVPDHVRETRLEFFDNYHKNMSLNHLSQ